MKEQLIHILDQSVCLSRKQMKEYLGGAMLPEETHAAEVHLSSCPLCSLAMEGFSEHSDKALEAIAALNSGFLKDHFDNISPQIHLNSMAPAAGMAMVKSGRKRESIQPLWRVTSIAAAMLLLFGLIWAFEHGHNREAQVAQRTAMSSDRSGGSDADANSNTVRNTNGTSVVEKVPSAPAATDIKAAFDNKTVAATTVAKKNLVTTTLTATGKAASTRPSMSASASPNGQAAQSGSVAAAGSLTLASAPSAMPEASSPAGTSPLKEPPATKTFQEYDPSVNSDQSEKGKKESSASNRSAAGADAIAAKSAVSNPMETRSNTTMSPAKPADTRDNITRGDDSYSKGSYAAALTQYKKGMTSSDAHTRYQSMVMAAQCYAALGNKAKAEELLQRVIDNGPGADRRAAKRALRRLK